MIITNKSDLRERIKGLNEYMLSDTDKKLILLSISSDYTYNKAIALINKNNKAKDWYAVDYKNCFKTWNEACFLGWVMFRKIQIFMMMKDRGGVVNGVFK